MPWDISKVDSHMKGLSDKGKRAWVEVANSALSSCLSKGGDQKTCEASAIRQANSVAGKFKLSETNNFSYLIELSEEDVKSLQDKTEIVIDVFKEGQWQHPKHGKIEGNQALFNDFITNWKSNVLGRDLLFDKCHDPDQGSTGIVKDLFIDGNKLKAKLELTNFGKDLIENKGFRYFSPEYTSQYTNKENGNIVKNVLIGGALTNRPFLTNLAPIILSEPCPIFADQEIAIEKTFMDELLDCFEEYLDKNETN